MLHQHDTNLLFRRPASSHGKDCDGDSWLHCVPSNNVEDRVLSYYVAVRKACLASRMKVMISCGVRSVMSSLWEVLRYEISRSTSDNGARVFRLRAILAEKKNASRGRIDTG